MTSTDARIDRLERQVEALLAKVDEQAATIAAQAVTIKAQTRDEARELKTLGATYRGDDGTEATVKMTAWFWHELGM